MSNTIRWTPALRRAARLGVALVVTGCGNAADNTGFEYDAGGRQDPVDAALEGSGGGAGGRLVGDGAAPDAPNNCGDDRPDLSGCACPIPGGSRPCFTGEASKRNVGACKDGTQTCVRIGEFWAWSACTGETVPQSEVCTDSLDHDCNGLAGCRDPSCPSDPTCVCTPATTEICHFQGTCSAGTRCGPIPDGCGGTIDCGGCAAPDTCGGAGYPNLCGRPTSTCDPLVQCQYLSNCGGSVGGPTTPDPAAASADACKAWCESRPALTVCVWTAYPDGHATCVGGTGPTSIDTSWTCPGADGRTWWMARCR